MENQPNSSVCFLCGINNPIGLKLSFWTHGEDRCITCFRPKPGHQGYPRQLHGGIISTLLDVPTQIVHMTNCCPGGHLQAIIGKAS